MYLFPLIQQQKLHYYPRRTEIQCLKIFESFCRQEHSDDGRTFSTWRINNIKAHLLLINVTHLRKTSCRSDTQTFYDYYHFMRSFVVMRSGKVGLTMSKISSFTSSNSTGSPLYLIFISCKQQREMYYVHKYVSM